MSENQLHRPIGRRGVLSLLSAVALAGPAFASRRAEVFNTGGLAISGCDPVAYFTASAHVSGQASHSLMWRGATWQFSSAENMERFEMNPEAYAPQYGGYCAYAMAQGAVAPTVPEAWTIHEGRLYLNYSTGVRDIWRQDMAANIARADSFWPAALDG